MSPLIAALYALALVGLSLAQGRAAAETALEAQLCLAPRAVTGDLPAPAAAHGHTAECCLVVTAPGLVPVAAAAPLPVAGGLVAAALPASRPALARVHLYLWPPVRGPPAAA